MSKSRGVLIVLLLAGILWALSLSTWHAGPSGGDTLGPAGVATPEADPSGQASPVATACVAVIAVCGLLSAMLGRLGRLVVLGLAGLAGLGYAATALSATFRPGSTGWAVAGILAGVCAAGVIASVAFASARWTNSNRYDRDARTAATPEEFDSTAAWDALSRGDDPDTPGDEPDTRDGDPDGPDGDSDVPGDEPRGR